MRAGPKTWIATTAGAALVALSLGALGAGGAGAITPAGISTTTDPLAAAAGWLSTQFENSSNLPAPDGDHFEEKSGGFTFALYGQNADSIFGLAAAKAGADTAARALQYLADNLDDYADVSAQQGGPYDGSVAKVAVAADVADVASLSATDFGGTNLLQTLKTDECTAVVANDVCEAPGAARNIFSGISESLAILAEARGGATYAPSSDAISYFLSLQCASGGFSQDTTACGSGAADVDSTSYAIMALQAVTSPTPAEQTALTAALAWLAGQQNPAGYWIEQNIPNTNSTGLAEAALQASGTATGSARTWLLAQQVKSGQAGAGALKYGGTFAAATSSLPSPSALGTAQGLLGLVDDSSLATLTASGSSAGVAVFAPSAVASTGSAAQGAHLTVTAHGFAAGESVSGALHSTPIALGSVTADPSGGVTLKVTVPSSLATGAHTIVLTGASSGLSASVALSVTAAPVTATSSSTTPNPSASASGGSEPVLAATGQNRRQLDQFGLAALSLLVVGGALLWLGRRRRA